MSAPLRSTGVFGTPEGVRQSARFRALAALSFETGNLAHAMFDTLSERLGEVFDKLRGRGALAESDVVAALREVRASSTTKSLPRPCILRKGVAVIGALYGADRARVHRFSPVQ